MMLKSEISSAFNRDIKRCIKRNLDISFLKEVMYDLICEKPLDPQYKDHVLIGNWKGYRELHIQPDWLLIYRYGDGSVYFARTGTHSELFDL